MDQKKQLVHDYFRGVLTVAELSDRYGVSPKTIYKWVARFELDGARGLADRSRRPHGSPQQTPQRLVDAILELQSRHGWGAKKLRKILVDRHPAEPWPSVATFSTILARAGRVASPRRRRAVAHPGKPCASPHAPNLVWSADFKGQFRTRDGRYCYPLTVTDNFSRYVLACQGLASTATHLTKPVFVRIFREYGLPERIRTDNGVPFATPNALGRLSALSAWWVRLGILPDLIEPGKPQQNGRHERMHRTLKAETARPPAGSLRAQQRRFNAFLDEFNHLRPHEALALATPASQYTPSPRPYPETLPPLEYPAHFETRYVSYNGGIRWRSNWVSVRRVFEGDYIGLEEVDTGTWDVYYGPLRVGRFFEQLLRIEDRFGRLFREVRHGN
jgi:transposase InsO family protein